MPRRIGDCVTITFIDHHSIFFDKRILEMSQNIFIEEKFNAFDQYFLSVSRRH
jgi:hypothetical protein